MGIPWPARWAWGWDPLRSMKGDPKHKHKTTRKSEAHPDGKPAPAGNTKMDLKTMWQTVVTAANPGAAVPEASHHNPEWDVFALEEICYDPAVFKLMWSNSHKDGVPNGAYTLAHKEAALQESLAEAHESLEQPAAPGWKKNPLNGTEHCARLKCSPGCDGVHVGGGVPTLPECKDAEGPAGDVKGRKKNLAYYWDRHYAQKVPVRKHMEPEHDADGNVTKPGLGTYGKLPRVGSKTYVENVAAWSNYYAAGQDVRLGRASAKGKRDWFVKCEPSDFGARTRYRIPKNPDQSAAEAREDWGERITPDHIHLAHAIQVRAAALGHHSKYGPWVTCDEGSMRDPCINDACTRDCYEQMWKFTSWFDYSAGEYSSDGKLKTGGDPIIRIRFAVDSANRVWAQNYDTGQWIVLDEFSHKGAGSRFCPIGMYFANKPIPHSIDWLMFASSNAYPLHAHVFMKDGRHMSDIVWGDMWDSRWNDKGKIMSTDSRFMQRETLVQGHRRQVAVQGTVKVPGSKKLKGKKRKAAEMEAETEAGGETSTGADKECAFFPMCRMDDSVRKSVPRGHLQRQVRVEKIPGCQKPMVTEANLWVDGRDMGILSTAMNGPPPAGCTTTRHLGKKGGTVQQNTFPAQKHHAKQYGKVDVVGRGAAEYGIDSPVDRWDKRIPQALMNVHSHAMFILVRDQLSADPADPLLQKFKGNGRGITAKKRFLLAVTREVIQRSIRRIRADPRLWDPSTDRAHSLQKKDRAAEIAKFVQAGAPQSPAPNKAEAKPTSSGRPRKPRPHSFSGKGFNGKNTNNNSQKCMHTGSDGKCKTRTVSHCPGCRVFLCPKHRDGRGGAPKWVHREPPADANLTRTPVSTPGQHARKHARTQFFAFFLARDAVVAPQFCIQSPSN